MKNQIQIVRGSLARTNAEAIVNFVDCMFYSHGWAMKEGDTEGKRYLQSSFAKAGPLSLCQSAIVPAENLPARCIVHTVVPLLMNGDENELAALSECTISALDCAAPYSFQTIAFPLIPMAPSLRIDSLALRSVLSTVQDYLNGNDMQTTVLFCGDNDILIKLAEVILQEGENEAESVRGDSAYPHLPHIDGSFIHAIS